MELKKLWMPQHFCTCLTTTIYDDFLQGLYILLNTPFIIFSIVMTKKEIIRFFLDVFLGVVANSWSELSFINNGMLVHWCFWPQISCFNHFHKVISLFPKKGNCSLKPYKCEMDERKGNPNQVGSGLFSCFLEIIKSKSWVQEKL